MSTPTSSRTSSARSFARSAGCEPRTRLPAPERAFYAGRILAAIFFLGIYVFGWFYNQMEEPNKHFASNWAQEDDLVKAVEAVS
jgi:hypothetical protein